MTTTLGTAHRRTAAAVVDRIPWQNAAIENSRANLAELLEVLTAAQVNRFVDVKSATFYRWKRHQGNPQPANALRLQVAVDVVRALRSHRRRELETHPERLQQWLNRPLPSGDTQSLVIAIRRTIDPWLSRAQLIHDARAIATQRPRRERLRTSTSDAAMAGYLLAQLNHPVWPLPTAAYHVAGERTYLYPAETLLWLQDIPDDFKPDFTATKLGRGLRAHGLITSTDGRNQAVRRVDSTARRVWDLPTITLWPTRTAGA